MEGPNARRCAKHADARIRPAPRAAKQTRHDRPMPAYVLSNDQYVLCAGRIGSHRPALRASRFPLFGPSITARDAF